MRLLSISIIIIIVANICGCSVGPDYAPPQVLDFDYADLLSDEAQQPLTTESLTQWWQTLNDPLLTELIHEGLEGSLDLKNAHASIREVRARLGIARAGLLPQLDSTGQYNHNRTSANMTPEVEQPSLIKSAAQTAFQNAVNSSVRDALGMGNNQTQSSSGSSAASGVNQSTPLEGDYYQAGFDATWEIDIFGGTRRSVQAAGADLLAQEENLNSVRVSLAAEIALSYVDVRTAQRRLAVALENLTTQQGTLEILESRQKTGLSDELAVQQARYNLERTRSTIPGIRTDLERAMNSLAVLTGVMPGTLHSRLEEKTPIPTGTLKTVTGIPADTLRQRPDVRVIERQLMAQTARVGVATADLYPKLYLLGSIGWESLNESKLFSSHSLAWSLGPRISWPIFHGGSIRANIEVQNAVLEQLVIQYEKAVLQAAQEVRDALVAYAQEQQRRETLIKAVEAAQTAVDISQDKYKNGLTDFNNVLDAQRSLLSFQGDLAISEGTVTGNLVRLYKALGGGWQAIESAGGE